ncbi:MAG: AzlC family ABC transporter permease [bacterium]|nr:AzlC family ABC transporter permease [bacterium]MDT8395392.1 AzlC family ABC transporter permease [bacterium]
MIRRALSDAIPIVVGYIPMGAAYGILARQAGMEFLPAVFMSLVVFAGASQFIAVGLLAAGATAFEVVGTTLFVNLRHVLMSASLSPHYQDAPRGVIPFVAWGVTDETFAISIGRYIAGEADHRYGLTLHYTAYASWVSGTVAGALAGTLIPPALQSSLEFSLYAMFVGLVILQITDRLHLAVAALSAALCTLLTGVMKGTWPVIAAAILGATVGLVLESWTRKRPSAGSGQAGDTGRTMSPKSKVQSPKGNLERGTRDSQLPGRSE